MARVEASRRRAAVGIRRPVFKFLADDESVVHASHAYDIAGVLGEEVCFCEGGCLDLFFVWWLWVLHFCGTAGGYYFRAATRVRAARMQAVGCG